MLFDAIISLFEKKVNRLSADSFIKEKGRCAAMRKIHKKFSFPVVVQTDYLSKMTVMENALRQAQPNCTKLTTALHE